MAKIDRHSIAYQKNIHNHSDAYYTRLAKKGTVPAGEIGAFKTKERAAYQAYLASADYQKDLKNGFQNSATGLSSNPEGESSSIATASSTAGAVSQADRVASSSATADGYSVTDAVADMKKLAQAKGTALPPSGQLEQLAQGIIDGVNKNFSGKNGIGDFSKVSGKDIAQTLISSVYQESKLNTQGQDAGGPFQAYITRVGDYNAKFGTNHTQADLASNIALAAKVSTWAMANPTVKPGYSMVGTQAGNVPIPTSLTQKVLYYWNYNPNPGHGHANELEDYMQQTSSNMKVLA